MKQLNTLQHYAKYIVCMALVLLTVNDVAAQAAIFYRDDDRDGWGGNQSVFALVQPSGYATRSGDCDDWNSQINPDATEVCNFQDDDCDGVIDEGCEVYYRDNDEDGWGLWHVNIRAMTLPEKYSLVGGDCNDGDANINPWATEICNGINDDCDGLTDENCTENWARAANRNISQPELVPFNITAYPNPGKLFNLRIQGDHSKGKIMVRVFDYFGRLVETRNNLSAGQIITLGSGYTNGTYILEAVQGASRKSIRVTKL